MNGDLRVKILRTWLWVKIQIVFSLNLKKICGGKTACKLWKKKFLNLWETNDVRCGELLNEFLTCELKKITHHKVIRKNKYSPILFCVIKDDILKIKYFMNYYRELGVEVFIFLDNNSHDGTREYLCQQKDTIVYCSTQQYSSARRVAWLNRLLAIYGQDKWCLIVDSDELVTYIGKENYQFADIIKKAVEENYYRIEGFLLDMYSNKDIFQEKRGNNFIEDYRYFDKDSYELQTTEKGIVITRGPRKRIFHADVWLSKYPLFLFRECDFIASSHYMVPAEPIRRCPIWFAICHYKFMYDTDLEKIKEAVRKENYAGGSQNYKEYLSTINSSSGINFYEEGKSCEMKNSYSLVKIPFLKSPFK